MIRAFYSAASGTASYQKQLNVTANNMANASTAGFKAQRANFSDLIYTRLATPEEQENELLMGNGVRIGDVSLLLEQGSIKQTGYPLDAVIKGEGFFAVRTAGGKDYYTRAGDFKVSNNVNNAYLVTSNGDFVLNDAKQPITINGKLEDLKFLSPSAKAAGKESIKLGVFTFDNPYALEKDGYGRFSANAMSGEAKLSYDADIQQGALEASNVDMVTEMSKLIEAQRGFQFSAQIIRTADELENTANNLRG